MSVDTGRQFEKFVESISLTKKQNDRIDSASRSLREILQKSFGLTADRVFLQGSFANDTAIRPIDGGEYDVDIVVESAFQDTSAAGAIHELYTTLNDGRYKGRVAEREPCVRLDYADEEIGGFHVDVVPLRRSISRDSPYEAPRKGSGWHVTAPQEYTEWCLRQGEEFSRTVRMIKRWRDENEGVHSSIKSIILQVLISRYMPSGIADDAERVAKTFSYMSTALEEMTATPEVFNPVLDAENLARRWSKDGFLSFRRELKSAAEVADQALRSTSLVEACEYWGDIFGDAFPLVSGEELQLYVGSTSHAKVPADAGWSIDIDTAYHIRVSAYENRGRKRRVREYKDGGRALFASNRNSIEFVAEYGGPSTPDIWWQVTNTGDHARVSTALRGAFFKARTISGSISDDPAVNVEKLAYTGSHIIEAFSVVGGVVVARSGRFIVNILSPARRSR